MRNFNSRITMYWPETDALRLNRLNEVNDLPSFLRLILDIWSQKCQKWPYLKLACFCIFSIGAYTYVEWFKVRLWLCKSDLNIGIIPCIINHCSHMVFLIFNFNFYNFFVFLPTSSFNTCWGFLQIVIYPVIYTHPWFLKGKSLFFCAVFVG